MIDTNGGDKRIHRLRLHYSLREFLASLTTCRHLQFKKYLRKAPEALVQDPIVRGLIRLTMGECRLAQTLGQAHGDQTHLLSELQLADLECEAARSDE